MAKAATRKASGTRKRAATGSSTANLTRGQKAALTRKRNARAAARAQSGGTAQTRTRSRSVTKIGGTTRSATTRRRGLGTPRKVALGMGPLSGTQAAIDQINKAADKLPEEQQLQFKREQAYHIWEGTCAQPMQQQTGQTETQTGSGQQTSGSQQISGQLSGNQMPPWGQGELQRTG